MKAIQCVLLGSIFSVTSALSLADGHEVFAGDMDPAEPMSIQANVCNLNDGVSIG
jgi:hypothetical protein